MSGKPRHAALPSRRDFMARAAGTGLLLAAESMADTSGAASEVRVALIGAGRQGLVLADALARMPGVRIAAYCDIWPYSRKRAAAFFEKQGLKPNAHDDCAALLASESQLDAAIVATPDFVHAEHAIACMDAGLHVYCEAPMAHRTDHARCMVMKSRATNKLLQIGYQRRGNPRYIGAVGLVHRGLLGRVGHGYAQCHQSKCGDLGWPARYELPPDILEKYGYDGMAHFRNWQWFKRYSAGPAATYMSHQADVLNWALQGMPVGVLACGGLDCDKTREWGDSASGVFDYATPQGVARASLHFKTTNGYGGCYERIMGFDGHIRIAEDPLNGNYACREARAPDWTPFVGKGVLSLPKSLESYRFSTVEQNITLFVTSSKIYGAVFLFDAALNQPAYMPHLANFFDAIRNGTPLNCPGEAGYAAAVLSDRVNQSIAKGAKVACAPEEFVV